MWNIKGKNKKIKKNHTKEENIKLNNLGQSKFDSEMANYYRTMIRHLSIK